MAKSRKRGSVLTGPRILVLVAALTAVLAIAVVATWQAPGDPGQAAARPAAAPPLPSVDPQIAARELVVLAPELTPASAEMLAREFPGASGQGLAEMGLLFASSGFDLMERDDLRQMGVLFEEVYATLPPDDRQWMGQYMRTLREGNLSPEESARGRQLLTQGVTLMPAERRAALQALNEKAIAASLEARRKAKGRTPPPATPAAAPLQPHQPAPPNSPAPEPAGIVPSSSPSAPVVRNEAYWRTRMKEAREKAARLKKEADSLDAAVSQNSGSTTIAQRSRIERLTRVREELAAAERAIGEIEEEARKAGALPGWLRE
jgi:hypothetical protein